MTDEQSEAPVTREQNGDAVVGAIADQSAQGGESARAPEEAPAVSLNNDVELVDWYNPPTLAEDAADDEVSVDSKPVQALPRRNEGPGRVISVISGKAGTGKSTIAANVAAAVSKNHGLTTAVVDLSLQFGDQALMFDCPSSPSMVDVLANIDALTGDFLLDCMHRASDLRILSAPPSPELADLVDSSHLQVILALLRVLFDVVVLDTTSHLSDITLEAMDSSDVLLVVATPYLPSVKDTKLLLKTLSDLGVPARKLATVLNRPEAGIKMGLDVLEANLKFPITLELPHVPLALIESVTDGIPHVLQKPGSDWGQRIAALADIAANPTAAGDGKRTKRGFLGLARG
ncbi:MAG TPA: P-loop NTPase [Candidatus Dormibacteraeota bacterium]|jgi:pilus assembly protein CpaE|nr:P-loop NTPase [Candidatus Dormibacteraeota bacterium]